MLPVRRIQNTGEETRNIVIGILIGCLALAAGGFGRQSHEHFGVRGSHWDFTKSAEVDEGRFAVTRDEATVEILAFLESLTGRIPRDALEVPLLPRRDPA